MSFRLVGTPLCGRLGLLFVLGCVALAPASAAAQELRFTTTAPGGVTGTGNTLGLSKSLNTNGPGLEDSIGTFLSLGNGVDNVPENAANPWPPGTTNDWTMNGSSAVLGLPIESEVLYAEVLWGGSYLYLPEDVSASLGSSITLSAGGASVQVAPDPATALTTSETAASGFDVNYYLRSADVTAFVQAAGADTYSVSGVPATQTTTINSLNAAGWTLVVVYRDEGAPTRNLSVFVGGSFVDEDSEQDYLVSGFCAPPAGVVEGNVVVSAIEGDADLAGDQLLIAPTAGGPFVGLSAPNNPADNFFCSQLNDASGQLDPLGSFGDVNHDAAAGVNVVGGRQGWDVTTVPLTSEAGQLENGQTSAVVRTITTGDSFMPILAAFAIDVNAPEFTGGASSIAVLPAEVALGDTFTVTATLENSGDVTAQGIDFAMPLAPGVSLVSFATNGVPGDINGAPVDAATLAAGVDEGDLPSGQSRQVTIGLEVVEPPAGPSFLVKAKWSYGFEVCSGEPLLPESFTQGVLVQYDSPAVTTSSSSSSTTTTGGGGNGGDGGAPGVGGNGGSTTVTGSGGDAGTIVEAAGCGCEVPGDRDLSGEGDARRGAAAVALLALGLAAVRRRRARAAFLSARQGG